MGGDRGDVNGGLDLVERWLKERGRKEGASRKKKRGL